MEASFTEQLAIAIIAAVVGALVAALLQRLLDRDDRAPPQTWNQVAIFITRRVEVEVAPRANASRYRPSSTSQASDIELVALLVAAALGLASVLLHFRDEIIAAIIIGTAAVSGLLTGALGYLLARRALTGWEWTAFLGTALAILGVGTADAVALDSPAFPRYDRLLEAYESEGLAGVIDDFGMEGVTFATYQAIGVVALAIAAVALVIALCFATARANYARNARGLWLWQRVARLSLGRGTPTSMLLLSAVLAIVSFPFASGLLHNLLARS